MPDLVSELARHHGRAQAADVERQLLDGANIVARDRTLWIVPRWTERPILRARIELARRRHRRAQ